MSDWLLNLYEHPLLGRVAKSIYASPPPVLERQDCAIDDQPLSGRRVLLCGAEGSDVRPVAAMLEEMGASVELGQNSAAVDGPGIDGVVFDGRAFAALKNPADFDVLYDVLHANIEHLKKRARVLFLLPAVAPKTRWVVQGVVALMKSLGKELGRKGIVVNALCVPNYDADHLMHLAGPLTFFLSKRCAFISGQCVELSDTAAAPEAPKAQEFKGQRVLVTGAARGIGAAIAKAYAREGAHVFCLDRPGDALALFAESIGGEALALDVTADNAVDVIESAAGEAGIDVIVHNAGVTRDRTLRKMKRESWEFVRKVNLDAVVSLTEALSERRVLNTGGSVVLLSSVTGFAGNLGQTNYALTKGALIGLTESLAATLGRRRVTINAIAPGLIETEMTGAMPFAVREAARRLSNLRQGGAPQDVAEAALLLTAPSSRAISRQTLRVCGGAYFG